MNVGQGIQDSVQLVVTLGGLNFQLQAIVVGGEMVLVIFWGLWATKGLKGIRFQPQSHGRDTVH